MIAPPSELVKNVRALNGDQGVEWLAKLPEIVHDLEVEWAVSVGAPFNNGEYNYVARAVDRNRRPCVVKIAPPRGDRDHFSEAKYLALSQGRGAVALLAHDPDRMAMLIERAIPGKTLTKTFEDREPDSIEPAIEVLRSTSRAIPADLSDVILLDDWFDGLRRSGGTAFPAAHAEKALDIYDRLRRQTEFIGYLHGDFHPDNIVSADRAPFLLIDPKGMIGHLGYEIAVFLNNFHWWQDEAPDIRERLDVAIRQFANAFEMSELELREWAFAQMVLAAWWTFDEMPENYTNDVAKADIWDV